MASTNGGGDQDFNVLKKSHRSLREAPRRLGRCGAKAVEDLLETFFAGKEDTNADLGNANPAPDHGLYGIPLQRLDFANLIQRLNQYMQLNSRDGFFGKSTGFQEQHQEVHQDGFLGKAAGNIHQHRPTSSSGTQNDKKKKIALVPSRYRERLKLHYHDVRQVLVLYLDEHRILSNSHVRLYSISSSASYSH
ncbi:hypothetical protein NE237_000109 [Protea cynaroides]|uniref:Uncharacterized protein n=1 Tax=Protea cynaroides TaxID=273540 RepID=A0A9Q0JS62_9MAGN|nr:hypothetical protein NE237_000109 [Protea cynaroides]